MGKTLSLDDLWNSASRPQHAFDAALTAGLPQGARRYLQRAIASGTPLSSAVRLRMHGEIKLKAWYRFSAQEVICWGRGLIWQAAARMYGLPIRGGDCFVDGHGAMRWKLCGIVSIVNAAGPDIDRSAAGRVNIESIWLPSVLCGHAVSWTASDQRHPHARFTAHGETAEIDCALDETGQLKAVNMPRWGNPDGGQFGYFNCGGLVEEVAVFGGYTIPTRMRVGWYFGTDRFEREGEFFRVTVDHAAYR
jgi:Family of unknown function (DUF6920)